MEQVRHAIRQKPVSQKQLGRALRSRDVTRPEIRR
jgi:hypothetical protein